MPEQQTTQQNTQAKPKRKRTNREKFDFKKLVKRSRYAKLDRKAAALRSNKALHEEYKERTPGRIVPGNLCLFHYYEPKTKEDLEYYDAEPLTIFFGIAQTSLGKRVVGLNLHYYPPFIRQNIMDKIIERYGALFKSFDTVNRSTIVGFNWNKLNKDIQHQGLAFGIRMYIPSLMAKVSYIPVRSWPDAFYTEGAFKKQTRSAIMKYWKKFLQKVYNGDSPKDKNAK